MTVSGSTAEISNVLWTGIWGQVFPKGNQFSVTPGSDDCGKVFHITGEAFQIEGGTYKSIATASISHRFTCGSDPPDEGSENPPNGSGPPDEGSESPPKTTRPRPVILERVSGDGQQGPAGADLAEPFVIKVRDQNGNTLAGAAVTFEATAGGGTLSIENATTDANGTVATMLTLGAQPGTNTVVATVSGLDPVTFTATGLAIARTMEKVSGDEQQGPAGADLAEPFVIKVRDQNGNTLAGAAVTFEATAGGGTLSAQIVATDTSGMVAVTLTLGAQPGTNTVVATVSGLDPVTFTATGLAIARTMKKASGDEQQGAAGAELAEPLTIKVSDQNGNPLAGATVTFTIAAGGGTLSAHTATTDRNGKVATTLTLGAQPGANTVVATVSGLDPVTFTATGLAIARTMEKASGDEQQGPVGAGLSEPFAVTVKDQNGNPLAGAVVTFAVATGTGTLSARTATTDSTGRAATTLTLGTRPGANTVVATVTDLDPVTFTATGKTHPDFNRDGIVDFTDFALFAAFFGLRSGEEGYDPWFDLDENGMIGFSDFLIFARAFGTNPSSG